METVPCRAVGVAGGEDRLAAGREPGGFDGTCVQSAGLASMMSAAG